MNKLKCYAGRMTNKKRERLSCFGYGMYLLLTTTARLSIVFFAAMLSLVPVRVFSSSSSEEGVCCGGRKTRMNSLPY